jgi:hypothetical protein
MHILAWKTVDRALPYIEASEWGANVDTAHLLPKSRGCLRGRQYDQLRWPQIQCFGDVMRLGWSME